MKNMLIKALGKLKNKALVAGAVVASAAGAFADGTGNQVDTSKVTETVQEIGNAAQKGLEAAVTAAMPYVTGALIAVIAIYVAPLCWKWMKRIFGR